MINSFSRKLNQKIISKYDKFIDKKSNDILNHDYFHSNITLSRNHLIGSELLKNLLNNSNHKLNYIFIIKIFFLFYIKNF